VSAIEVWLHNFHQPYSQIYFARFLDVYAVQ